jgi:hypothetical protein
MRCPMPAQRSSVRSCVLKILAFALLILCISVPEHQALAKELTTQQAIHQKIKGKRIFLKVPFGGEFPLYYQANGRVDGSGEAVGLGRWFRPNDQGKWWVESGKLCQQWQTWYDGKVFCFSLTALGPDMLTWTRDDGYSGKARIGL